MRAPPQGAGSGFTLRNDHVISVTSERIRLPAGFVAGALSLGPAQAEGYQHPTPTEPEITDYVIHTYSRVGEAVLDPMCGTGTFVRRALSLGRNAFGADVVEEYVRLANVSIAAETRFDDRVRLQSALHLSRAKSGYGWPEFRLCFFCPPLLRVDRPRYPVSAEQVGNYEDTEHGRWLDDVCTIVREITALLGRGGYLVALWRDQKSATGVLPNVELGVARILDLGLGHRLIDEKVVLFENQGARAPETLHVFRLD